MKGYGEFIKKHRKASGFKTQKAFAEATGISNATISRIEKEIQRPEADTLTVFSKHLKTTSLVELMVVAGYWSEEDLLEPLNYDPLMPPVEVKNKRIDDNNRRKELVYKKVKTPSPHNTEKEFTNKLELSDEKLLKEFELQLDGKKLTEDEAKGVIAYLRSFRQIEK